jgi:hypothetical protein
MIISACSSNLPFNNKAEKILSDFSSMVQKPPGSQGLLIIKASQSHLAGLFRISDQPNAEITT